VLRQAVSDDPGIDRAGLARLRDDNAKLRAKCRAVRHRQRPGGPAVTADRDRYRTLTALAVLVVAAIAAVVSYLHVASLAIRYCQPPVAAYLLPLSIDGLVAVASLVMLRAARMNVTAPWLARTGLVLAVLATLACNVAYGLPHDWPGALLSGGQRWRSLWPPRWPYR
jgi:hypothetical protein